VNWACEAGVKIVTQFRDETLRRVNAVVTDRSVYCSVDVLPRSLVDSTSKPLSPVAKRRRSRPNLVSRGLENVRWQHNTLLEM